MPKDEFDLEDPLELVVQEVTLGEEHLTEMAECFIEEFARMGYRPNELLALFHNPFYRGPHSVYLARGEQFICDLIEDKLGLRPTAPTASGLVNILPARPAAKR